MPGHLGADLDHALFNLVKLKLLRSPSPARRRSLVNLLGLVILLGGLGSATFIWCEQDQMERRMNAAPLNEGDSASTAQPLSPEDSRRYTHDVEMSYGQTGLLVDKWKRWWAEWTHGKPLAKTIAVASLIMASGLFYAGAARASGQPE